MKLVERAGHWSVRYKDTTGRWRRFATGLPVSTPEDEALRIASAKLRDFLAGSKGGGDPVRERKLGSIHNVAEALEACYLSRWKGTASDVQLKYVVRAMERDIGHWLLTDMPGATGYSKIKGYRDALVKDGSAPATANRRISTLKVALREAVREGHMSAMPEFPDTLAENNIIEREMNEDEEAKAFAYLDAKVAAEALDPDATGEWVYLRNLVASLMDTGARLSEVLKLKACDGQEAVFEGVIVAGAEVVPTKSGRRRRQRNNKAAKTRRVPLTARAKESIAALLAHPLHGKVTVDWCGHRWMMVRRALPEINDCNLHILRHTFACRLLALGTDLYVVSKLLGHASVDVTAARYGNRVRHSFFEQAIARLQRGPVGVSTMSTTIPQVA